MTIESAVIATACACAALGLFAGFFLGRSIGVEAGRWRGYQEGRTNTLDEIIIGSRCGDVRLTTEAQGTVTLRSAESQWRSP